MIQLMRDIPEGALAARTGISITIRRAEHAHGHITLPQYHPPRALLACTGASG